MMMDDGGGAGFIIGIMIVLAIAGAVIAMIVFLAGIILAGVLIVGSVVGLVIAVINLKGAVEETAFERRSLRHFKDNAAQANSGGWDNFPNLIFEEHAAKMYIMGPIFYDIVFGVIVEAVSRNFQYRMDFSNTYADSAAMSFMKKAFVVAKGISVYVFGTIATVALCALVLVLLGAAAAVIFPVIGLVLLVETIYFKIKQINFRCSKCKKEYNLPKYICPNCGMVHIHLKPGRYGILRRRCLCGAYLPLVAKIPGRVLKADGKHPIRLDEMRSLCPHCGADGGAGLSHTISIALIGGASSGKTTFKVAFQHEFIDTESGRFGMDISFPDDQSQKEYSEACRFFDGKDIIPSTNRADETDITTFSVNIKNNSFTSDRTLQIYDLPGECFASGDVKESWEHYSFTEGAVFLIDPFSLEKVAEENNDSLENSRMGICTSNIDEMMDSMIATLNDVKVKKTGSKKMTLPIALVIGKCDTDILDNQCGDAAVQRLMDGAPDVFVNKFDAMDFACRCFLADNGYDNFIQSLDNNFENVHFFSCSAVGGIPTSTLTQFAPKNVLEIMQWLMIRADKKNIGEVWKADYTVNDITDERKRFYITNRDYYDRLVLEPTLVNN